MYTEYIEARCLKLLGSEQLLHECLYCRLPLPPASKDITEDSLDIVFQECSPESISDASKIHEPSENPTNRTVDNAKSSQVLKDADALNVSPRYCKSTSSDTSSQHSFYSETNSSKSSAEAVVCSLKPKNSKRSDAASTILVSSVSFFVVHTRIEKWMFLTKKSKNMFPTAKLGHSLCPNAAVWAYLEAVAGWAQHLSTCLSLGTWIKWSNAGFKFV